MSTASITFAVGFTHDLGPACVSCPVLEAHCAWAGGCCPACTHWVGYDAAGHRHASSPRREQEHGTERGYQQHRHRKQPPCIRCCAAHSLHNQKQAS